MKNTMMTTRTLRAALICLSATLLGGAALAQDLGVKAPPQSGPIAIENATIHTITGQTIAGGHVAFDKGIITSVGPGKAPRSAGAGAGAAVIDAKGLHVYPGLIGAQTVIGLVEIGAVRATVDYAETGDISPEVRAAVSVNPDSTVIPVTRSNGILTVGVMPLGGLVPGRAAVIRMDGWTWEDMAIDDDAGVIINWPSLRTIKAWWVTTSEEDQKKRAQESLSRIDSTFASARAYLAARKADPATTELDLRWESLRGALENHNPVFIRAQELEQIESAVAWAVKNSLRPVIVGGRDAMLALDTLKRHDVPVMLSGVFRMPRRDDAPFDDLYSLPAALEAAGLRWCLASASGANDAPYERSLPYEAGKAAAYGLSKDAALKSITIYAANLLGVADKLGSLETGKAATIILTDGDPLEITTHTLRAFIDGREIDLSNKQTALEAKYREKYRQLGILKDNPAPSSKN